MTIGDRIKQARVSAGASRAELADAAGLNRTAIYYLEKGQRTNPTTRTLQALASALGCSLEWLLTGEGVRPTAGGAREAINAAKAARVGSREQSTGTDG